MSAFPKGLRFWFLTVMVTFDLFAQVQEKKQAPENLETIVVTATKKGETDIQRTPMAVSVYSGEDLEKAGADDMKELAGMAPGVHVLQNVYWGTLYIRGIGTNNVFIGSDPSATLHLDGVYLSRPTMLFLDLLDIERVEVLRGPQGTLYGRNSIAGTVNVISKMPAAHSEGFASLELGKFDRLDLKGYYSFPIVDEKVLASLSFLSGKRDGYVTNLHPSAPSSKLNNEENAAARAKFRFLPNPSSEITLSLDFSEKDDRSPISKPFLNLSDGTPVTGPQEIEDPFAISIPIDPIAELRQKGLNLSAAFHLRENLILSSTTSYRTAEHFAFIDNDFTELDDNLGILDEDQEQVSQEIRIQGNRANFSWVGGLFFFHESLDFFSDIELPRIGEQFGGTTFHSIFDQGGETTAWAAFFEGDYAITPIMTATLGLRVNHETKTLDGTINFMLDEFQLEASRVTFDEREQWTAWTPKLGFNFQFDNGTLVYVSAARGFKSGGFNFSARTPAFDPELLWSYEAGLKSDWLRGRMTLNGNLFYYDYTDLQVQAFIAPSPEQPNPQVAITNAANATIEGFELETTVRPVKNWEFQGALTYLDATYDRYIAATNAQPPELIDVSGNRLNSAPEWSYHVAAAYRRETQRKGSFSFWTDYQWQGRMYYTAFNQALTGQDAFGLWNAQLGYTTPDGEWEFSVFGRNLRDEVYYNATADFSGFGVTGVINPPRTYGASVSYRF